MRAFIEALAGPLKEQGNKLVRPQDRRGQHLDSGGGQHAGLLLQRYLCENATGDSGNPEEKRALLKAAINAARNTDVQSLYRLAYNRWKTSRSKDSQTVELESAGRVIVGLGSENVLETGIRLHQTYGIPIIPGSALKGLAAHYCDQIWGDRNTANPADDDARKLFRRPRQEDRENNRPAEPQGNYHRTLFGATDDSGCILFHDAWFVPGSAAEPLRLDVMTPHHPDYNRDPEKDSKFHAPTDFDSPTPVPFLSVAGKFLIAVSWHGPSSDQAAKWTELALTLLREALSDWGVGGKTSSGYGRLVAPSPPPPPQKRAYGVKAQVKIVANRPKGGFDVHDVEAGRKPGTLTLGVPPLSTDTSIGAVVDVLVHVDDLKRPQYRWPQPPKK